MKVIEGTVKKLSDADTVIVEVERLVPHKVYGKVLRRTTTFKADYQGADLKVGDKVSIVETRPISKDKNFKILIDSMVAGEASKGRKGKSRVR